MLSSAFTASVRFIPSGVSSNAQANSRANGNPISTSTVRSVSNHEGRLSVVSSAIPSWMIKLDDEPADDRVYSRNSEHISALQLIKKGIQNNVPEPIWLAVSHVAGHVCEIRVWAGGADKSAHRFENSSKCLDAESGC